MSEPNLIAYIPTLNQRHLEWFARHKDSELYLITQRTAEVLLPRLGRNLASVPEDLVVRAINGANLIRSVGVFTPGFDLDYSILDRPLPPHTCGGWIMPDEDVSHLFAERYLVPEGCHVEYEMIWARWDMQAVLAEQPVIPDVEISIDEFDRDILREATQIAKRSPDWWRQVGAIAFDRDGVRLAAAYNTHVPNEYETYLFGDPALNRDAGQKGKSCALHAEAAVIATVAGNCQYSDGRWRRNLYDGKMYVTTFPCEGCAALIVAASIRTVYFMDGYSSLNAQEIFKTHGVKIVQVKK
jgi:dCMP deaminase